MGTSVSAIITVTTPPLGVAPGQATGLTVSNLTATSLTLSWVAPGVGSLPFTYQVQSATPIGSTSWVDQGGPTGSTSVGVTGLKAATGYSFQVITSNSTGSSTSASVSATTLAVAPGPPTGLSVAGSPTQTTIPLQWNAPLVGTAPLTYQALMRSPSGSGAFSSGSILPVTSLTTTITGLIPAETYDFEVTASNSAGTSAPSAILSNISTTSPSLVLPSAPTNLTVGTITSTSIALTWSAPATGSTPMSYVVQYQVVPSGASPNDTVIDAPGSTITDTEGNVYGMAFVSNTVGNQVTINGVGDSSTNGVQALVWVLGSVWYEALVNGNLTWLQRGSGIWENATTTSPFNAEQSITGLTLAPAGPYPLSSSITISGVLNHYAMAAAGLTLPPTLSLVVNGGTPQTVSGNISATGFSFTNTTGLVYGTNTLQVYDQNNSLSSATISFTNAATGSVTLSNFSVTVPSSGTVQCSFTPSSGLEAAICISTDGVNYGVITASATSPVTISSSAGFRTNTGYYFKMFAVNTSTGQTGPFTAATLVTPIGTGGVPAAVTVTATENPNVPGQLIVAWNAPASGTTGPITYSVATAPSASGPWTVRQTTQALTTTLTLPG